MNRNVRPGALVWLVMGTVIASSGFGCGKEELAKITDQVKEATVEKINIPVPQIKIQPIGEMQLATSTPVSLTNISLSVLVIGDGRPNVLQIQLSNPNPETVPAVFVRAMTTATSAAQLVGQTVPVKMFVQPAATGNIWSSPDDRPVSITFDRVEETEVVGRINAGVLVGTDGTETPVSGSFRAVITQPGAEVRTTMILSSEGTMQWS
jgi:hypothetical protein